MITGEEIDRLVDLLLTRGILLHHACQLIDFRSYLIAGGVPSRAFLEKRALPFTPFDTDRIDRQKDVWDKVFVNLEDFGQIFVRGRGVPNPYGPILLHLDPTALKEAMDVAVCLRPVGAKEFQRAKDSLRTVSEIDRLFRFPPGTGFPASTFLKSSDELRREFPRLGGSKSIPLDISCTARDGILPFSYLRGVLVDRYLLQGWSLISRVRTLLDQHGVACWLYERQYPPVQERVLSVLAAFLSRNDPAFVVPALSVFCHHEDPDVRDWANRVAANDLEWQFDRFARYLRVGTLLPILGFA